MVSFSEAKINDKIWKDTQYSERKRLTVEEPALLIRNFLLLM